MDNVDRPLPQLSIEIWSNVFRYLNDKAVDVTMYDRPDASDLTRCMRVSSAWFLAAGKALYAPTVFIKSVPAFLRGHDIPIKPLSSMRAAFELGQAENDALEAGLNGGDARRYMASGNFKRPLLRFVTRIVVISCDIETRDFSPAARATRISRCIEDWDLSRSMLGHPALSDCCPLLKGVRIGQSDFGLDFHYFWRRNGWARYEPKDRGRLLLNALKPTYWCEAQSGFLYSLPCPTRITDYEAGRLPKAYTYHATTAEGFRILWGTRNMVVYLQDDECNGPRNKTERWGSQEKIVGNICERLLSLLPPWLPPWVPDHASDNSLPKIIRDTTFVFQGVARNWHWDVELLYADLQVGDPDPPLPKGAAGWAALGEEMKRKEIQACRDIEQALRARLREKLGGTEEFWDAKVKLVDTVTHHPDVECPSCGAEWNYYLETYTYTTHDDRHDHTCTRSCCHEVPEELEDPQDAPPAHLPNWQDLPQAQIAAMMQLFNANALNALQIPANFVPVAQQLAPLDQDMFLPVQPPPVDPGLRTPQQQALFVQHQAHIQQLQAAGATAEEIHEARLTFAAQLSEMERQEDERA